MSLRVWLPLTKDLRQQGLDNVTVTNNGATFNFAGKLGGCYEFASGKRIQTTLPSTSNLNSKAISFACWVNISSWNSSYDCLMSIADGTGWQQSRATLCRNNTASTLCWNIADGNTSTRVYTTTSLSTNTWYHIACTYDGASLKIYVNGTLNNSTAATLSIGYAGTFNIGGWSGNNYPINCKMNDVRVYSHCLSPMEVKELAKGLVLHYPLNRQGWGQENLILESHKVTGGGQASGITRTYESDGSMKIVSVSGNGTWCSLSFAKDSNNNVGNNMAVGDVYSISCDTKIEVGTVLPTLFINNGNGYKQLKPVYGSIITNKWMRVYYTSTWAEPGTSYGNISLHLGFGSAIGTYYFKNFKLEKGSIPTPWCPNIADSNNMGLNSTVEYDCSGFCNNGTRTGTFTWTSDTPKYNVSTIFPNNCNTRIFNTEFPQITKNLTFACWCKVQTGSNSTYSFIISQGRDNTASGFNLILYNSQFAVHGPFGTVNSNITTNNTWTHLVGTYDGTAVKIYINGELKNSLSYTSDLTYTYGPAFVVGKMAYSYTSDSSYFPTNGSISDVRAYATALSADDVKSLYQNSAYIDSSGNVYGAIHTEV